MNEWWETLSTIQKVFYYFAIPSTVLLIIQTILTIIGFTGNDEFDINEMDGEVDFDADTDVDTDMDFDTDADDVDSNIETMPGLRFFTIRGMIAFFCIFGWTGLTVIGSGMSVYGVVAIAVAAGVLAMLLIALLFYAITHLQSSGNVKLKNTIGRSGTVYIPIPAKRVGSGKIQIKVQERLVEADAVTDAEKRLGTGMEVIVTDMTSTGVLVVEKV